MSTSSYINATRKLVEKLSNFTNFETQPEIASAIKDCRENGLASENNEVSVFVSKRKLDDNQLYVRCIYMIKTSNTGKVKNIDSTMQLISNFEHEFVCADKIDIVADQGVIFVDIYKLKME